MLRIMSFLEEATGKELVLPVTPAKYSWRHPNGIETVQLDQLGEITASSLRITMWRVSSGSPI